MSLAHPHPSRQYSHHSPSASPSPTASPYISTAYYNPLFNTKTAASTFQQPTFNLNYAIPPAESYYLDSRQSTPSDRINYDIPESQYMQNSSSHYPEVRVQQSTPNNGAPATPPPLVTDDVSQPAWDYQDSAYLAPSVPQHYTPSSYRSSHKRLSSGSSVGSTGPDSPYTQSLTYPQIVDSDNQSVNSANFDLFDGSYSTNSGYPKSSFSGSSQPGDQSLYPAFQNFNLTSNNAAPMMAAQTSTTNAMNQARVSSLNGAQAGSRGSYNGEADAAGERRVNIPQLDRTMSDVYQDELYNPAMAQSVSSQQQRQPASMQNSLLTPQRAASQLNDYIQVANNGHISARSNSPASNNQARRSPFREGYAPPGFQQSSPNTSAARLGSAAQMRERQKIESDAQAYAHHNPPRHDLMNPPKTISPKEALLDYHGTEEESKMPLFPSPKHEPEAQPTSSPFDRHLTRGNTDNSNSSNYSASPAPPSQNSSFTFMPPTVPAVPQQYPFISQSRRQSSSLRSNPSNPDQAPEFPASLTSMESTKSDSGTTEHVRIIPPERSPPSSQEGPVQRPLNTSAGSGTFTCVGQDCAARFDTAAKLQKHKREAHRTSPSTPTTPSSATANNTSYNQQAAANNVSRNNQPGPHKCEKLNPSTGKPCNTVFSRSYDLTRHEDTIHNNRKQKVRCHLCTEEKTFSRNDALTRHMRVVHPDVDFPGKTRRGRNSEGVDVVRQRIESGRGGR
ncbi:hypothetical protein ACLMJK_007443 [Lecanora helva]